MNVETYLTELSKSEKITSILDIGANVGSFSTLCQKLWPGVDIAMIEGNIHCAPYLHNTGILYYLALLGDTYRTVNFHIQRDNLIGTGASYYKEVTTLYEGSIVESRQVVPLDSFIDRHFDLIKIDTQGSELDIIRGGRKVISGAKYIILELSVEEYNKGAPLLADVMSYMVGIGFDTVRVIDLHIWQNQDGLFDYNQVFQMDAVFTKSTSR